MDTKIKSKWLYIILISVISIGIIMYLYGNFKYYRNMIYDLQDNTEELNKKVKKLESRIDSYESRINNYESQISVYQSKVDYLEKFQNSYSIETEVPYEFIEYTKFEKDIIDYRYIDLKNQYLTQAKVKVKGVNNVIDFFSHTSRKYQIYYSLYKVNN